MRKRIRCPVEALAIHSQVNNTAASYPALTISELFEQQVVLGGDSCALVCGRQRLTYREVNRLANGLADGLIDHGVRPGHTVGVCLDRSIDLIVALIAITKCGATYLPFDANWPHDVLADILSRTRCRLALTRSDLKSSESLSRADVMTPRWDELPVIEENPEVRHTADGVAYINFTSGTTGVSKGVQISHRSVSNLVLNPRYARLGPGVSVLHMSPTAFDAATFEIWGPLLTGGTCVLYPRRAVSFSELRALLAAGEVNCVFLTTALFNVIEEDAPDILANVESILFGGEAYSARHVGLAYEYYGPDRLTHVYGPTECTTFATYHAIDEKPSPQSPLPIGRPIQNTKVYVVRDDVLCAAGEIGQILLAGPGLSVGYVGEDAMTRSLFVDLDIAGEHERVYMTGDYGYLSPSGEIVFEGRVDDQVKVNGFRIELAKVSLVLGEHPNVRQSYLTVSDESAGEKVVLAFVVPRADSIDSSEIRRYLGSRLPQYMVPGVVYFCDSLPLLATGKVDRKTLVARHRGGGLW